MGRGGVGYAYEGETASQVTQEGKGDDVLGGWGAPIGAGDLAETLAGELGVGVTPGGGVELIATPSGFMIADRKPISARLDLTNGNKKLGVRLGEGGATEEQQGDDREVGHDFAPFSLMVRSCVSQPRPGT